MEILAIIFLLVVMGGSYPIVWEVFGDGRIMGRTVKVVKANLNKPKQVIPGIVTSDMRALSPRNKDWGPDGKLTQMWQDAFDYWSIDDPAQAMQSWLEFKAFKATHTEQYEDQRDKLQAHLRKLENSHMYMWTSDVRTDLRKLQREYETTREHANKAMTPDMKIMERLDGRYGTEVYYNNDMVRLSAQKNMPTFDYIALTSV